MHPFNILTTLTIYTVFATPLAKCCPVAPPDCVLEVETSSGVLNGFINASAPSVRQFLGVPFALPPTGTRRWQPPSKLESDKPINATNIGPACPQQPLSATPTLYVYAPSGGNRTEFFPLENFSEDCLTLNVWTPEAPSKPLPVFVWYFGGGFVQGGTNSLYFNPQSWVQRTQQHIVVTVNFRSNIFGFPNANGLTDQNLGLLDQRLALEWVRDNIANFGGDPLKIVTWGESAGAIAADYLNFAYLEDPIISGIILESSTALFPPKLCQSFDKAYANFSAVAIAFGCATALSPVDCLKNVTWQDIQDSMVKLNLTSSFLPTADERLVFSNYAQRYEIGAYSSAPAIIGSNQHEANALIPPILGVTLNETHADEYTNATFLCTAAIASQLRETTGRTTYRYRYDGNFPNISPPDFPGAYHAAELPLIFGTAGDYHGASTTYEDSVSRSMQDMWLEFAKDPLNGLRNAGWCLYADGKAVLIGGTEAPFQEIDILQLDSVCNMSRLRIM
ncbi:hypothetical protein G7Y89_g3411 [Cudoniella acicularis]|uniref:Carboxylesterase type B domain-containing protein n=1 Tax=Cudoniella acicularis TaxID=354080 RepID=A0A8H4W5Z8_9HELO|nr:hypothetical protein G7Y89_g3411 [Cudoniella acicularis]